MAKEFTIAITGDSVISRRLSVFNDEAFMTVVKLLREADVACTHLEGAISEYDGPETYPAAESGWTWLGLPTYVASELKWAGFDMVSHAGNHCLDYSYGGLMSTWKALDEAGLPHTGTGRNLGEAREPAYVDTGKGRLALISMTSTFSGWARAGDSRSDMKGRPGVNPLRFCYRVDASTLESIKQLAAKLGWVARQAGKIMMVHPSGIHHSAYMFVEGAQPGPLTEAYEDDVAGNIRAIKEARKHADWVYVDLHTHEFHAAKGMNVSSDFVQPFARACIDAGVDVFVANGSHADLRGIELYKGKPIFYDPGQFIGGGRTIRKLPADFYWQPGLSAVRDPLCTPADAFDAREALPKPYTPPWGYAGPVPGSIVAVCSFGDKGKLTGVKLQPITVTKEPRTHRGIPMAANAEAGKRILSFVSELSAPFGTSIDIQGSTGQVKVS